MFFVPSRRTSHGSARRTHNCKLGLGRSTPELLNNPPLTNAVVGFISIIDIIALDCQMIEAIIASSDLRAAVSTKMSFYILAGTSSVNENLWGSLYLHACFRYRDIDCKSGS